jgi:tetratricopeptide (TPR) repeat protein
VSANWTWRDQQQAGEQPMSGRTGGTCKATISLCMMVKNEHAIIGRAIRSALPWVDEWLLADTGSTDRTKEVAAYMLADLPGRIEEHEWRDFGHNRTLAFIAAAASAADYALILDADQTLVVHDPRALDDLRAPGYMIETVHGTTHYGVERLLRCDQPWQWLGTTHERLDGPAYSEIVALAGVQIIEHADSHRRLSGAKGPEDLVLLERALEQNPTDPRTLFYAAQAWQDAGEHDRALALYFRRLSAGGHDEEQWMAQYRIARILHGLGRWEQATAAYLLAVQMHPTRAEPLYWLGKGCMEHAHYKRAIMYLGQALRCVEPRVGLFVESWIYRGGAERLYQEARAKAGH